jgi:16S rRNA U516 pseudouridylate synthase RsuA-like enzyme
VRITIGDIGLGELQPGEWRDLSRQEKRELKGLVRRGDRD